jgi:hypothetical protein
MPNDERVQPLNHEVPARMICVPKTAKGPRIIAAEPSEHMYVQKLMANWLEEKIETSIMGAFINFRDQSASGKLVIKASLDRDLATIDLSSASDRLSLYVVERMFRSNPSFLKALHASRTRWLRLPTGECIELKKFASQGTALTFPVQTLVFFIIAMAVATNGDVSYEGFRKQVNKVRIFGDDIIIPNTGFAEVVDLLHMLNLKVNVEKSFSCGYFRESCGVDAFKGYDITPVKPKTTISDSPASRLAVLDTSNNLFYKGYWYASEQLRHRQRPRRQFAFGVVGKDAGATGYVSYSLGTVLSRMFHAQTPTLWDGTAEGSTANQLPGYVMWRNLHERLLGVFSSKSPARPNGFGKLRWNPRLHRIEVRRAAISESSRVREYDHGYSGLLDAQLRPHEPQSFESKGVRGVPERPHHREVMRWEALSDLF